MVVIMTLQINTFNKSLRLHQEREPLETPIEVEKVHHPEEQYGNDNRYQWTRQAWTETKITEKQ
jgi:hypothetical protein